MSNREELYKKFGPLLLEAVVRVVADEINILRAKASLPARSNQEIITAINNKLASCTMYDWMND